MPPHYHIEMPPLETPPPPIAVPHVMAGIPPLVFWVAVAAVVMVTALLVAALEMRGGAKAGSGYFRIDLLGNQLLLAAARWRPFQFVLQLPLVLTFFLILAAGFFGEQSSARNIAPVLTWTVWWAALVVFILFLGKIWCLVCPWNAIAQWIQRLSFWGRVETTTSLNLRWPRRLRNIFLATGLFVLLTWLELGFGVTTSPWATAALGVLMLTLAVVSAMYFHHQPFCHYGCLVGRVSGLYALFSPVELRSRDKGVCRECRTKDCVRGNEQGYGCPVFEYLGTMDLNNNCILCSECVKTCPKHNVAFNVRPFGADLGKFSRLRADEAYLALVMVSLTSFHGVTMTPLWGDLVLGLRALLGGADLSQLVGFTLGMGGIIALPMLLFWGVAWASQVASGAEAPLKTLFISYAYSLLPLALCYHLGHNLEHLFREGQKLVPLLSDPFGWGWNLLGTAHLTLEPLLPLAPIQYLQVALIVVGQVYAVQVAHSTWQRYTAHPGRGLRGLMPMLLFLAGVSTANLGLLAQPMEMRTAM